MLTFNRTRMELKRGGNPVMRWMNSNAFNRTRMELKHPEVIAPLNKLKAFNRTRMELKLKAGQPLAQ